MHDKQTSILFVDDEPTMREMMAMLLSDEGYEVLTAVDGFDALAQLRTATPKLIISDLNMPRMSGFEFLSVVRRRFPAIPVIAISGAYDHGETLPEGVIADAFYPKSRCHPDELMRTVAELIASPVARATNYRPCCPPAVQTSRIVSNHDGTSMIMLTCPECLRAFPNGDAHEAGHGTQVAECKFCSTPVHYVVGASREPTLQRPPHSYGGGSESASLNWEPQSL
jgi:CheY-like chemotaxis protein